jgi:hypothetical protein
MNALRSTDRAELVLAVLGSVAVLAIVGLAVAVPDGVRQPALVALIGVTTLAPMVVRGLQGRFDPFEPIIIICAAGFVLFFLRPLWMWIHDDWVLGPYDLRDGLTGAAIIVLVGFTAMLAGYFMDFGRRLAQRIPEVPDRWDPTRVTLACVVMLILAGLLFLMFIGTSGGFSEIKTYFSGRDNTFTRSLTVTGTGADASSAYLYLAPYVSVPITLMLLEVWRRRRSPIYAVLGLLVFALVLLMTVPRGDRTYLLALILPLIVLPYLRRGRRPRLLGIVAVILAAMIVFNVLVHYRATQTRDQSLSGALSDAASHPLGAINDFMLGADVSMMSILSAEYTVVPSKLDYKPGQTLTSVLARPVPGLLWKNKPEDPQLYVHETLFPRNAAAIKAGFTSSMLGGFYADSGFVGTFIYGFVFGIIFRSLFEYWRRNSSNPSVAIFYAAMLPMLIILMRANPAATAGLTFFLIAPIPIAFWWGSRRRVSF